MQFATIEEAIAEVQEGRIVIIVDDEDRENEGDLMIAADKVTPEAINFMARHGRGLICLAMTGQRLDDLQIPLAGAVVDFEKAEATLRITPGPDPAVDLDLLADGILMASGGDS